MKLVRWKFELDQTDGHNDYLIYSGKSYIGLICGEVKYQLVLGGRSIGTTDKLWKAKIKFICKYYLTRLLGV